MTVVDVATPPAVGVAHCGVAVAFSFPLGRYHATAMGTAANDGIVEWPPSPWRVLRALYSVWRTRCDDLDSQIVEPLLGALAATPEYYIEPRTSVGHTRHYVPGEKSGNETTLLVHDTFIVCPSAQPSLVMMWPTVELEPVARDALARLVGALTWLGRAESLVDAGLMEPGDVVPTANTYLVPQSSNDVGAAPIRLLVPTVPLDIAALTVNLAEMRADRRTRSTLPPRAALRTFVRPEPVAVRRTRRTTSLRSQPTAVRFEIVPTDTSRSAARLALADALVHTAALRRAAMSVFGRRSNGDNSSLLSGRNEAGRLSGHGHAHYLALPGSGADVSSHLIDSLLVWVPDGLGDDEIDALGSIRVVSAFQWVSTSRTFAVIAAGIGTPRDLATAWSVPSRIWASATPVVPGRHPKGERTWEEQTRLEILGDCRERGLPEPVVELTPWPGRFTTSRPRAGNKAHRSHPHRFAATLTFPQPLDRDAPLTLGAHSHFGLGLFRPS